MTLAQRIRSSLKLRILLTTLGLLVLALGVAVHRPYSSTSAARATGGRAGARRRRAQSPICEEWYLRNS